MPLPATAPSWAAELALSYESGAHGQFILYGNVHDRLVLPAQLVNLTRYLEQVLLGNFQVIFTYDLGNGLRIERGGELVQQWGGAGGLKTLPREPLPAVEFVGHYLRYLANLRALGRGEALHVACIVRGADQIAPAGPGSYGYEQGALVSLLKDWAMETPFADFTFASILIADNLNDLHPLLAFNPRVARLRVPLPAAGELQAALSQLRQAYAAAFDPAQADMQTTAQAIVGVTVAAVESTVKRHAGEGRPLQARDWVEAKKQMVESDTAGLVEFVESSKTLEHYHGQPALKAWLRQDVALWQAGDSRALPMGYLFCGPVGTGKTYLVECLAGEAGVPVVKLKNFRDRWVGSSEGNLEKIFRLIRALGRCMVFVDEADQALGQRSSGSADSGLSGRLYGMIAQEMSDSGNRGRVMWILASSRPDLIEVDLKRPGRVDVKVPLLPTVTAADSQALLQALCKRYDLQASAQEWQALQPLLPLLLTPGAAEALAVKAYRLSRTGKLATAIALRQCLDGYQPPVPADVLEFQMRLAIREATDLNFVPPDLRHYAQATTVP